MFCKYMIQDIPKHQTVFQSLNNYDPPNLLIDFGEYLIIPTHSKIFPLSNVLGLCEEAELEAQMFNLLLLLIRIPNVQISTEPAFLQNPCYVPFLFFVFFVRVVKFDFTLHYNFVKYVV